MVQNKIYTVLTIMLISALIITCVKFIMQPNNNSDKPVETIKNEIVELTNAVVYANTSSNKTSKLTDYTTLNIVDKSESRATMGYNTVSYSDEENNKIIAEPIISVSPIEELYISTACEPSEEQVMEVNEEPHDEEPCDNATSIYSEYEIYELAKIIMCEAEGESQECKEYIGQVVINRVKSDKFPNTIHDVIFDGIQFSPTFDGRWESVEPTQECYDAAYTVINAPEPLTNALYFESCKGESWHSKNLSQVANISGTRFYTE